MVRGQESGARGQGGGVREHQSHAVGPLNQGDLLVRGK